MSLTGSSPLAAVRAGVWGLLLFTAASWLAIGWSVLRLEPSNMAAVAGAVILFGALTEVLRACAGTRTWWLNAGMAVLFAATAVVLVTAPETSYTTPLALIGWYLMVRGTVDIAVAALSRESDRVWGLLMVVGVLEVGLGFFAASPLSRTAGLVTILGAVGLLRAIADLVTALRIREVRAARAKDLQLPPVRALGLAGYTAGMTDYESVPARRAPRHRATTSGLAALSDRGALSRVRSERWSGSAAGAHAGSGDRAGFGSGKDDSMWPGGPAAVLAAAAGGGTAADAVPDGVSATGGMAAAGYVAAAGSGRPAATFHDEVLRTTADLDAILALAGVTGAGVGARAGADLDDHILPEVPDTPEGVESMRGGEPWGSPAERDDDLPILDQTERAEQDPGVSVADTSSGTGVHRSI